MVVESAELFRDLGEYLPVRSRPLSAHSLQLGVKADLTVHSQGSLLHRSRRRQLPVRLVEQRLALILTLVRQRVTVTLVRQRIARSLLKAILRVRQ